MTCDCVLEGRQPDGGTLAQSLAIMRLYEAYRDTEPGVVVSLV